MNKTRKILAIGATTSLLLAGGVGAAFASTGGGTPAAGSPKAHRTLAEVQQKIDARAAKLTTRLDTARTRIEASTRLSAAQKTTLDADLNKTLADIATGKARADAATTRAELKAARPALRSVKVDLAKLKTDRAAIRSELKAAHAAPSTGASTAPSGATGTGTTASTGGAPA